MSDFQPPPTYADPVLIDPQTKAAKFNPIWLKWFLDLVQVLNASGAGTGSIQHNSTSGLQGGTANQYYHLTSAQQALANKILVSGLKPTDLDQAAQTGTTLYAATGVPSNAKGANGDYYFRTDGGAGTYIYFKSGGAWTAIV